ncbi:MAG TPA: 1-phosphofructokinase family hexose kinase [Halanaerobiales bacterium]|nr:1-phosphofructokinase family hexose kinase [Halanaerobiales bacterium]
MILAITMNPSLDKVYLVDDFSVDKVFRTKEYTATAGGKGLNVARVIKAMGYDITASGLLGGLNGQFINNQLQAIEINNQFVEISGETRTCLNITDNLNNTTTEVLEAGPEIKEHEINNFLNKYKQLVKKADVITASGSLPRGLTTDFYRNLIKIANKNNKKIILDTSGDYLKEAIKEKPYMIKPNEEEISYLFKDGYKNIVDYIQPLIKLKKMGIKRPIITLGKKGALGLYDGKAIHFQPPEVEPVNVVGSGDAFVAGCAIGLLENDYIQTLKKGMACGIANTLYMKTGKVTKQKVEEFINKVKVKKIYEK